MQPIKKGKIADKPDKNTPQPEGSATVPSADASTSPPTVAQPISDAVIPSSSPAEIHTPTPQELFFKNLTDTINTIIDNQATLSRHLEAVESKIGGVNVINPVVSPEKLTREALIEVAKGGQPQPSQLPGQGKAPDRLTEIARRQGGAAPLQPQGQPQGGGIPPEMIATGLKLLDVIAQRFAAPPPPPKDPLTAIIEERLKAKFSKMVEQTFDQVALALDASDAGALYIDSAKLPPKQIKAESTTKTTGDIR